MGSPRSGPGVPSRRCSPHPPPTPTRASCAWIGRRSPDGVASTERKRGDRAVAPRGARGGARGRGGGPGDDAVAAGPARLGAPPRRCPGVPRQHDVPAPAERPLHRAGRGPGAGDRADDGAARPADHAPQGDARQLRLPRRVGGCAAGADPGPAGPADGAGDDGWAEGILGAPLAPDVVADIEALLTTPGVDGARGTRTHGCQRHRRHRRPAGGAARRTGCSR